MLKQQQSINCFRIILKRSGEVSQVRSDHGGENIGFMISTRGTGWGSMITGSSTHNQRIQRTWRDVNRVFVCQIHNLFYFFESTNQLNPLNEMHLNALHYVFITRINRALKEFILQHNNHPLCTEHSATPLQLFLASPMADHVWCWRRWTSTSDSRCQFG